MNCPKCSEILIRENIFPICAILICEKCGYMIMIHPDGYVEGTVDDWLEEKEDKKMDDREKIMNWKWFLGTLAIIGLVLLIIFFI